MCSSLSSFLRFSLSFSLSLSLSLSFSFSVRRSLARRGRMEREGERARAARRREERCTHTGVEGAVQGYRYGQVEPLVLLNLITSGPGGDRYFRVSFPGNRPRDSAARHILYAFRLADPIYNPVRLSVRSFVHSSIRPFVQSVPRSLRSFVRSFARFINRRRPELTVARIRIFGIFFFSFSLLFFSPPDPRVYWLRIQFARSRKFHSKTRSQIQSSVSVGKKKLHVPHQVI